MIEPLRILQLNAMKSRTGMEAMINDRQTTDLDILPIQEPSVTFYQTQTQHRCWHLYQPTLTDGRCRSLIYINKRFTRQHTDKSSAIAETPRVST